MLSRRLVDDAVTLPENRKKGIISTALRSSARAAAQRKEQMQRTGNYSLRESRA
jgi:hypothetical protein